MKRSIVVLLCGLTLLNFGVFPLNGECQEGEALTIDRAVEIAVEKNVSLRASLAEIELAQGELKGARVLTDHNPELSGGVAFRVGHEELGVDASAGLGQTFELGRPRRHRIAAAHALTEAATDRSELQRQRISVEAKIAFVRAVSAKKLADLSREAEQLSRELSEIAKGRLSEDVGTELEVNLAVLEWAGAKRALIRAIRDENEARLELSKVLSAPPDGVFVLATEYHRPAPVKTSLPELVQRALANRPDLSALEGRQEQLHAEHDLARAEAAPELTIEASYDFEEQDHIVGVGLSIPLPFFQRNQGEIARSKAQIALADLEVESARLAVESQVRAAFSRYETAREIAEVLSQETIERSSGNLELLRASFEEGNVGFVEVLLVQREFIAAQRDAVQADADLFQARMELELAVGGEVR